MAGVNSFMSDPAFHSAEIRVIFRLTQFSCVLDSEYKLLIFPMENGHLENQTALTSHGELTNRSGTVRAVLIK